MGGGADIAGGGADIAGGGADIVGGWFDMVDGGIDIVGEVLVVERDDVVVEGDDVAGEVVDIIWESAFMPDSVDFDENIQGFFGDGPVLTSCSVIFTKNRYRIREVQGCHISMAKIPQFPPKKQHAPLTYTAKIAGGGQTFSRLWFKIFENAPNIGPKFEKNRKIS